MSDRKPKPSLKSHQARRYPPDSNAWWYEDRRGIDILIEDSSAQVHRARIGWGALRKAMLRCAPDPPKRRKR